jgi:hypothetical protein
MSPRPAFTRYAIAQSSDDRSDRLPTTNRIVALLPAIAY